MDVIAAIATGSAATAIGIVRVSGDGCFALCGRVFRAAGGRPFAAQEPRKMVFGEMLDRAGRVIDRGLAVRFPGPGSYTGEDCAEFHCHGSPVVLHTLLSALFAAGARQAQAGEFTKRAFLNGKMDLTEAEAVIDLIHAETTLDAKNAAGQLGGAVLRRENRRLLRDGGLVIFLDRSPWAIRRTLRRQGRPLLTDDNPSCCRCNASDFWCVSPLSLRPHSFIGSHLYAIKRQTPE